MAAIITDQLRILNAKNFVSTATSSVNSYYSFVGLPNATSYSSTWNANPPSPKDSFDQEEDYWDTMVALKKITTSDIRRMCSKYTWTSGVTYDMYRGDISRTNIAKPSGATSLSASKYYIVNDVLEILPVTVTVWFVAFVAAWLFVTDTVTVFAPPVPAKLYVLPSKPCGILPCN